MEIQRAGGDMVDYPDAQTVLEAGDRLLIVGEAEELATFDHLASGEVPVPAKNLACQWLTLPDSSPVLGKTLADLSLNQQYTIQVQAIRREGKFTRFPDSTADLEAGDRLLLCGAANQLNAVREWLVPVLPLPVLQVPVLDLATVKSAAEAVPQYLPTDGRIKPEHQ